MVRAVGYALGCGVVWLGCALEGGRCGRRNPRCVLRGRAAMDADNRIGREGAASLAPVLEKMPQLTSLDLGGARIRFWARPRELGWVGSLVRAVGYALGCGVVWLGYALAGGRCVRRIARCLLRGGRRWMQAITSGLRGRHRWRRRWRRCRSSPRSSSDPTRRIQINTRNRNSTEG